MSTFCSSVCTALEHVNHEVNELTPLMAAAKKGHFNCAKALLWVGASILPKDAEGSKAPWILAWEENHKKLGDYLKQAYQEYCLTGMCRDHCAYCEWERWEEWSRITLVLVDGVYCITM